jgi:hypothetical protein
MLNLLHKYTEMVEETQVDQKEHGHTNTHEDGKNHKLAYIL